MTPEEIASTVYPGLTLGQVYAALAYYEDHRAEIERAFEEEARTVEEFRREHPELVRDFTSPKGRGVLKGYADGFVVPLMVGHAPHAANRP